MPWKSSHLFVYFLKSIQGFVCLFVFLTYANLVSLISWNARAHFFPTDQEQAPEGGLTCPKPQNKRGARQSDEQGSQVQIPRFKALCFLLPTIVQIRVMAESLPTWLFLLLPGRRWCQEWWLPHQVLVRINWDTVSRVLKHTAGNIVRA